MNKKLKLLTIASVAVLLGVIVAAVTEQYIFPNHATIDSAVPLTFLLDGEAWTETDTIEWGTIYPSDVLVATLQATNVGNVDTNVTLYSANLPLDWTITWASNKTILAPLANVSGDLTITVASGAGAGDYSWNIDVVSTEVET